MLVTVLGATVSAGAGGHRPSRQTSRDSHDGRRRCSPPSWSSWSSLVVVVVVGAVVPFELQATDSTPTATAAMPTVKDARLRSWAVVNDNGISLSSQSDDVTAR